MAAETLVALIFFVGLVAIWAVLPIRVTDDRPVAGGSGETVGNEG